MNEVKLELAALDSTDIGLVRSWRNDHRIWKWCRQSDLISDAEQVRWFNRQSEDPTVRMYKLVVTTDETKAPVGVAGLTSIDMMNRRAEFSLYIAPEMQQRGLGRRFLEILFEHGFSNLGLNLIWGETFDGNPAARMFEAIGMTKEGTRRQFYWRDGRHIDAHLYSITRDDWYALRHPNDPHDRNASLRNHLPGDRLLQAKPDVSAPAGNVKKIKRAARKDSPSPSRRAKA